MKHTTLRLMILASIPSIGSLGLAAFAAVPSTANNSANNDITASQPLKPSLVGVIVNGQEVDAIDILYDSRVNDLPANETTSSSTQTNHYYFVSEDDLSRLTGVVFEPIAQIDETGPTTASPIQYLVKTPIGDAQIAESSFIKKDDKNYLALSILKKSALRLIIIRPILPSASIWVGDQKTLKTTHQLPVKPLKSCLSITTLTKLGF